jgi:hypothetical protein
MLQAFDFSSIDPNQISDSFLKALKVKASDSPELFDNFYSEALEKEDKINPVNEISNLKTGVSTLEQFIEIKQEFKQSSNNNDEKMSSDTPMLTDETMRLYQMIINQMQINLIASPLPKPMQSMIKEIAQVVFTTPDKSVVEFQSKALNVTIKFERQDKSAITITIVVPDELQDKFSKESTNDMQKQLKSLLAYESIELRLIDLSESLLYASNGRQQSSGQQQQSEEELGDENEEEATNEEILAV